MLGNNQQNSFADKPQPKRLTGRDLSNIIARACQEAPQNQPFHVPVRLPKAIYNTFEQIEDLLFENDVNSEFSTLDINHAETFGTEPEVITDLTSKMFELVEMFENVDNDDYRNHLSEGSIRNVGMTVLRRCFYIALRHEYPSQMPLDDGSRPYNELYPFCQVDPNLLKYLSSLFLRIYAKGFQKQLFPFYAVGCLQLCCYTKFVGFNISHFRDFYWQHIYDAVFELVRQSTHIHPPKDERYWLKRNN